MPAPPPLWLGTTRLGASAQQPTSAQLLPAAAAGVAEHADCRVQPPVHVPAAHAAQVVAPSPPGEKAFTPQPVQAAEPAAGATCPAAQGRQAVRPPVGAYWPAGQGVQAMMAPLHVTGGFPGAPRLLALT